jgi:hypothetical protein
VYGTLALAIAGTKPSTERDRTPPRHRFLEPIHNVKEGFRPASARSKAREYLVFIPGELVEPIGIEPMTSSLQS